MSHRSKWWKENVLDVLPKIDGTNEIEHERAVEYAIEVGWNLSKDKIARACREDLRGALHEIGYRNDKGAFVRTTLVVKRKQGWLMSDMSTASEEFARRHFRQLVKMASADCRSAITQRDEFLATRGISIKLPTWLEQGARQKTPAKS